jgi:uncharacterized membrane protein YccC
MARFAPPPVRAESRIPFVQMAKTAVAAVLAWVVASLVLPGTIPVFATIAALLVVQPSVNQSYAKAFERSLGVLIGVVVSLGLALAFGQHSWLVLVATVIAVVLAWALRLTSGAANQIAISALLVLTIGAATPEYALARVLETVIGAIVALAVNIAIAPPVLAAPARLAVARLARDEADRMEDLASAIEGDASRNDLEELLIQARQLRKTQAAAAAALTEGLDSLTLNPRRSRHRAQLQSDTALVAHLDPIVTRVIGMTRAVRDHWEPHLSDDPYIVGIAEELRRAAHDLRLRVRGETPSDGVPATTELPALTSPISVATPPAQWVLIGALMEDLRRIREEITAPDDGVSAN